MFISPMPNLKSPFESRTTTYEAVEAEASRIMPRRSWRRQQWWSKQTNKKVSNILEGDYRMNLLWKKKKKEEKAEECERVVDILL